MALYIPHSIFHLARLLHVRPETFGPYYVDLWSDIFWYFCLTVNIRHSLAFLSKECICNSDPLSFVFNNWKKKRKFLNQNDRYLIPHHCHRRNKKVNRYSICPLVRTAPQWLPWIRPQGWRYRSDRILHAVPIILFLFYVQVFGKFPHRYMKTDTNSLRVFMHSIYSQHIPAYI